MELTDEQLQKAIQDQDMQMRYQEALSKSRETLENAIKILQENQEIGNITNDSLFGLSIQENELLENLAETTNQTKKEVLRKALALIRIAIISEKQGATIAIVKDGEIINEIIGLSTSAE